MTTTTTPTNHAAYLPTPLAHPLTIHPAPYPSPTSLSPTALLLRVSAIALNPIDTAIQRLAPFPTLPHPWILGCDVAGTVIAAGSPSLASRYPPGTLVAAIAPGFDDHDTAGGAFQEFVVVKAPLVVKLPESVGAERGVVLPLAVGTASAGLFEGAPGGMGLGLPGRGGRGGRRGVVVVWGASGSVGSAAVQLVVNAGYVVVATAGRGNWGFVRGLGAEWVGGYEGVGEVVAEVERWEGEEGVGFAGVFNAAGTEEALGKCVEVARRVRTGAGRRFVSTVMFLPEGFEAPEGVEVKWMWGTSSRNTPVGPAVFEEFLPGALEDGSFVPAPEPVVVGKGLEFLQKGLDLLSEGVSAKKVVVTL